jgi:uncharacterized protein (DUF885 family)
MFQIHHRKFARAWLPLLLAAALGCRTSDVASEAVPARHLAPLSESARLNQWLDARYEEQLQRSPFQLTMFGRKDRYDEVDDMSEAAAEEALGWLTQSGAALREGFDYEALDADARVSYELWLYQVDLARALAPYRRHEYLLTQMRGAHTHFPTLLIRQHRVDSVDDMRAYVARISGIARAVDQLRDRIALSAAAGIRPPRFAYIGVITDARKLITGQPFNAERSADDPADAPIYADARAKIAVLAKDGAIDADTVGALQADVEHALTADFGPAYQRLIAWMETDVANTSAEAQGASTLPQGRAYYDVRLAHSTTTELTADEIHAIGLSEVAKIRAEMEAIREQVDFEGTLGEFFKHVRGNEDFLYPNTDAGRQAYIDDSSAYLAYIGERLPDYFGLLPKAKLVVKRVESFREQDGAPQHYHRGTPDGSRPGIYYAHLSDMRAMPKNEMEAVAYHEGNPGHHMQVSIAQERENLPLFRSRAFYNAYGEGWALYAEKLAKEMGAYQTPHTDFGRLLTEMWRAIRLVVDTGIHAKGWSEAQAVAYFEQNSAIAAGQIRAEVRRYFVWPGQATGYKIGMLKIEELRARADQYLGDRFDIRAFHDVVLGTGGVPLPVLERVVGDWIEGQRNGPIPPSP